MGDYCHVDPNSLAEPLAAALAKELRGEVDTTTLSRAMYSTDASNYRVVPAVVAFPEDDHDLAVIGDIARQFEAPVTMRGAGTSCAGNAVGAGILVDTSRHLNRILDIDVAGRTATVQPGVVMDSLQRLAAPHGLRFGPDPSTHSRCTFGGMIGNNACGNHAVAYGRTADNVVALTLIDGHGRRLEAGAGGLDAVPGLTELVAANLAVIRTEFGLFRRQLSGYGLDHLLPEKGAHLAKALVGGEGTLGMVTEATLRLVPLARAPVLVVLGYPTLPDAADNVPALLPLGPLAVEGLDARLLEVYLRHRGRAPDLPEGRAWLMVEVEDEAAAQGVISAASTLHHQVFPSGPQARAMWRIREDGAGLGGRTQHGHQGWPGFEDAAVPPQNLGAYLRAFDRLLDEFELEGSPYGHLGDGCVHIRIDFPFERGTRVFRGFMEAAGELVVAHGGSLSGEHGDGRARSELLKLMYSPAAIKAMEQFKGLFDPLGLMNPGVKAAPAPLDADLRCPAARRLPARGGFAFKSDGGDITKAAHRCTGVAKCHADGSPAGSFMCPSFLASGEEKDSTRGRARVLQEVANGSLIGHGFDAPELAEALDLCLACKACSSDCPAAVDMSRLKSESLFRRYRRRPRPLVHYLLGWLPRWTRLASRVPALANLALHAPILGKAILRLGGLDTRRSLPRFAAQPFHSQAAAPAPAGDTSQVKGANPVLLWADSFSSALDPEVDLAAARVLAAAGHTVYTVPPAACCGLTWITTGQLGGAKRRLADLMNVLGPFAVNGLPIVGVEPSCTAALRSDLVDLLPNDPRAAAVARSVKTLAEQLTADLEAGRWRGPSLDGLDLVAQPHCHHHAVMGWDADFKLLTGLGAKVKRLAGCCGMAGDFGMTPGHYETSVKVAQRSLLPALADAPDAVFLADGFSCRTQAADLAGRRGVHLAQLLAERLGNAA
ncbi:MAG: FAD-binding oxidoreductase [Bifidobacteriaceae bacterium]|jgi:FAD/FMN-containing dehydrogenase/Fe-S oxidoreductase|nr:FAD-binding oxidoreductase [Bifidobacteriaceae bacterium]